MAHHKLLVLGEIDVNEVRKPIVYIIEYFLLLLPTIIQYTVYYVKFLVLIRLLMK